MEDNHSTVAYFNTLFAATSIDRRICIGLQPVMQPMQTGVRGLTPSAFS
jgi:hypothetical protein